MAWHTIVRCGVAGAVASLLAKRGIKKQSLDASGALAAFVVGFFSLASSYRFGASCFVAFTPSLTRRRVCSHSSMCVCVCVCCDAGVLLLGFYFTGSKLTKVHANVKQTLDANYKVGGQRSARQVRQSRSPMTALYTCSVDSNRRAMLLHSPTLQVLACSALATAIALYYALHFGDTDARIDFAAAPLQSFLLASYIGHYACCTADTWASELGVLSSRAPRLITTFQVVPPGTNGGVTLLGLAASALGGAFIGLLYLVMSAFSSTAQPAVVALGAVTGLMGSLLDSLLGATLQATWFDSERRTICEERAHAQATSSTHVCGVDVLTNEQVNAVSVLVTTLASGVVAQQLLFA